MTTRPFRILGVQQVAVGGTDKARLRALWVDLLGLAATGTYRSERENVDEDILAVGHGPFTVEVDVMQPIDPSGEAGGPRPGAQPHRTVGRRSAGRGGVADGERRAVHAGRHPQGRRRPRRLLHPPEGQRGDAAFRRGRADRAGAGAAGRGGGAGGLMRRGAPRRVARAAASADAYPECGAPAVGRGRDSPCRRSPRFARGPSPGGSRGYRNSRIGWSTARLSPCAASTSRITPSLRRAARSPSSSPRSPPASRRPSLPAPPSPRVR